MTFRSTSAEMVLTVSPTSDGDYEFRVSAYNSYHVAIITPESAKQLAALISDIELAKHYTLESAA